MTSPPPAPSAASSEPAGDTLTFIGNATVLLRLGSFTLLTDPNFLRRGQRAYLGRGMWSRRRFDPAMTVTTCRRWTPWCCRTSLESAQRANLHEVVRPVRRGETVNLR